MIKISNKRKSGSLFHYAHFICDCLFPEIINDIYKYKTVIREKNIYQTIGNFYKIYNDVMMCENLELKKDDFYNLKIENITYENKENYCDKKYFDKFRNYVFSRYNINPLIFDEKYPDVILIKRYGRINLIDDNELSNINTNIATGNERREISDIDAIEKFITKKYGDKSKSIFFEFLSFEEQVKYFNNAKLIVCAHGAVMSNLFFCKEKTIIIEVVCDKYWHFFDVISNILNLNHIKCNINKSNAIIEIIENIKKSI
jgi:hypothetical protein